MNRYIVRGFVSILTFCIGLVVSPSSHRSHHFYRYEHERCSRMVVKVDPPFKKQGLFKAGPFLTIDTAQSDPVKLSYSSTIPEQSTSWRQHVEFQVNRLTGKGIANYTVSYRSTSNPEVTDVFVKKSPAPGEAESVSLECEAKDTLTVWVSQIQFKDGTLWENPRHRIGQSNL
ncbi:MAG TPA: hypothetical protein VI306_22030 [Pyrinomonadaceae bacterium]